MLFSFPILLWIVSLYEYFTGFYKVKKGSELYATVVIAWAVITIVVIVISIIIQTIAYYGFTDTIIILGIILAIILIGILKERLS